MSGEAVGGAGAALQAAVLAALAADPALAGVALFDAPPVRAGLPHVQLDEPVLVDWGAKGLVGREGTLAVLARDAGERPVRLRALAGAIEEAVASMGPDLGQQPGGTWRLANVRFQRSRIARAGANDWMATMEFRVRLYRA